MTARCAAIRRHAGELRYSGHMPAFRQIFAGGATRDLCAHCRAVCEREHPGVGTFTMLTPTPVVAGLSVVCPAAGPCREPAAGRGTVVIFPDGVANGQPPAVPGSVRADDPQMREPRASDAE